MKTNAAHKAEQPSPLPLTTHARARMAARRLSEEAVAMVMNYGRLVRVRGAEIYAIGRKEVERHLAMGLDLRRFDGAQVVCSSDGAIVTVYRNSDFRGLRPRGRAHHHRLAA